MSMIEPRYHTNPSQRTPCMLVLDASASMQTEVTSGKRRIDEINHGLVQLKEALVADETAKMRVQLAIIRVGGPSDDATLMLDWTDVLDFEPPSLQARGNTPLGHGMQLAVHHVDQQKLSLRQNGINYTRPWIMVISDGEPTDSPAVWQGVVDECRQAESAKRCVIFPIGVEDANLEMLQQLSKTPAAKLSSTHFPEYFRWLSASLSSVSRSRPGESVALPATSPWAVFG